MNETELDLDPSRVSLASFHFHGHSTMTVSLQPRTTLSDSGASSCGPRQRTETRRFSEPSALSVDNV
jgi:hypothetical protein